MFYSKCFLFFLISTVTLIVSGLANISNVTSTLIDDVNYRRSRAYSGDIYMDEAYNSCIKSSNALSCVKYKALKYLHKMATPDLQRSRNAEGLTIFGTNMKLVTVPENMAASRDFVRSMLPDSQPRSTDSELEGLYKFVLREAERFIGTHAISFRVPSGPASGRDVDSAQNPRLVDEENLERDVQDDMAAEGRGKKKKLAILLPLLLFFKLKILLVPILLGVLFIKKLLIIATVLFPSLLSLVKFCKPQHHGHSYTGWNSGPDASAEYSTGYSQYGHGGAYHGDYHNRRSVRWDNAPYRGYQRANEP